jgi:hypothetical protein
LPFSFANPLGFWALLGIPAVILIHFLQQRSRVVTISTLFLLDHLQHESVKGKQFDRLRSSIPFWLQLLAVLLLTWILVQPRWMKENVIQRIAIVLDGSASMEAFRESVAVELGTELRRLASKVHHTEYIVVDSHLSNEPIFNGTDPTQLVQALENWKPLSSSHDFTPALRIARSLVGSDGLVILVSDHLVEDLPYDARLLAIGQPTPNVGFAGLQIVTSDDGEILWKALVRNYSDQAQQRSWLLHTDTQKSSRRSLDLAPGQTRSLQGAFPGGVDVVTLRMDPDAFALDDQVPIVRPRKKQLSLSPRLTPELQSILQPVLESLNQTVLPAPDTAPDISLTVYHPLKPAPLEKGHGIVFLDHSTLPANYLKGQIYPENHPLTEGLNWQGLLARSSTGIPLIETDTPLLWQDDRSLVFLRSSGEGRKLIFNFDLANSNAARLPAFVVTIHRFVESVRHRKIAPFQDNFEIFQPIDLAFDQTEDAPALTLSTTVDQETLTRELPPRDANQLRAPGQPAFFTITQGDTETPLLTAASHFADTREADLRQAASRNDLSKSGAALIDQHTEQDARWQLWILALCLCLLVSWYFVTRPTAAHAS